MEKNKQIVFLTGDATSPQTPGNKIICHICNDAGAWGAGFVLAISKKWKTPEIYYRAMPKEDRILGTMHLVQVEKDISVANMIAQHGVMPKSLGNYGKFGQCDVIIPPIRYAALRECLQKVNEAAIQNNATLHMPRIGCGLAGGKWEEVEKIIIETITVDTYVYDFK